MGMRRVDSSKFSFRRKWVSWLAKLAFGALITSGSIGSAISQSWPERPVRFVTPYAVGGPLDSSARIVAARLYERLGQPFIVENKPGAGGNLGADYVAKSAPDGYTFLIGANATNAINPSLIGVPYDPIGDFRFVSLLVQVPNVVVVRPDLPINNVKDLIAYANQHPGKLDVAGTFGSVGHLAFELFKSMTNSQMVFVPYKGSAPAVADMLGGRAHLMFDNLASALPHIQSGRMRPIAVTTSKRSSFLPEVPTLIESGLAGFNMSTWWGIMAPANTPGPVVQRLNAEVTAILDRPDVREQLKSMAADSLDIRTPEQFAEFASSELLLYTRLVKQANAAVSK